MLRGRCDTVRPGQARSGISAPQGCANKGKSMFSHSKLVMAALLSGAMAMPVLAAGAGPDLKQPAGKDWPAVAGGWDNSRFSTLNQINAGNIKTLGGAWVHKFDGEQSRASPVVADGVMFLTAGAHVYAINPAT